MLHADILITKCTHCFVNEEGWDHEGQEKKFDMLVPSPPFPSAFFFYYAF